MPQASRLFAVVPAAGISRRMGEPKLLLPLGNKTVIARLLETLNRPDITGRFVVLRKSDDDLLAEVNETAATAVQPEIDPPDMRQSVEYALEEIRQKHAPNPDDGWLLVPADHPMLESELLDELIDCWARNDDLILVPTSDNRRGHPTFFRWKLAEEVFSLPEEKGLNELLKTHADEVVELEVNNPAILMDLDTPENYQILRRRWDSDC